MLYVEEDNLVNEIDRFLNEYDNVNDHDASSKTLIGNDNINASFQSNTYPTISNEVEFIGENRATFEILENDEYGVYEHDPYRCNWNVFYKPLSPEQHTANIKQEPGLTKIKKEVEENPIDSFSFIREYENLEKVSSTTQNDYHEFSTTTKVGSEPSSIQTAYNKFSTTTAASSVPNEINEQPMNTNVESPPPYEIIDNHSYSKNNELSKPNSHNYFASKKLITNLESPPPYENFNNNYNNSSDSNDEHFKQNTHDHFASEKIFTAHQQQPEPEADRIQVDNNKSPFVENSGDDSQSPRAYYPQYEPNALAGNNVPEVFQRSNAVGFSMQMKRPVIDTSVPPPWVATRGRNMTPAAVNRMSSISKQNSLLNKHARHFRRAVPHLMPSFRPQILKNLPAECRNNNNNNNNKIWPKGPSPVAAPPPPPPPLIAFENNKSSQCSNAAFPMTQNVHARPPPIMFKNRSSRPDDCPNTTAPSFVADEVFDKNMMIIANAMIKDYLSPVTLVGSTIKFESRKLANTGVREELERAFKVHGTISNSWWTPDDMLYVTYTARNVAKQVYSLYPANRNSSY